MKICQAFSHSQLILKTHIFWLHHAEAELVASHLQSFKFLWRLSLIIYLQKYKCVPLYRTSFTKIVLTRDSCSLNYCKHWQKWMRKGISPFLLNPEVGLCKSISPFPKTIYLRYKLGRYYLNITVQFHCDV